jgi:SAM-dependent methyltransferase
VHGKFPSAGGPTAEDMSRPVLTRDERRAFARAMEVRRLHPKLWHFSYWSCLNNRAAFDQFFRELMARKTGVPARILDIGCGFKPWLTAIRENGAAQQVSFLGTDFSAEWSDADSIALADALPMADGCVDGIILSEVVEHCPRPREVLGEAIRILKPGGVLLVTTPFVFPEHGVPYDFQRLTQYFYRDVFRDHEILRLSPSNCQFTTPLACFSAALDSSPFSRVPALPDLIYLGLNTMILIAEKSLEWIGPRVMRSWRDVFYTMPMGYAVVIRKRNGG